MLKSKSHPRLRPQEKKFTLICWRDGALAVVKPPTDEGSLSIAMGTKAALKAALHGTARLAYDGKTWLCPGMPEAENDDSALDALIHYRERLLKSYPALKDPYAQEVLK